VSATGKNEHIEISVWWDFAQCVGNTCMSEDMTGEGANVLHLNYTM